MDLHPKRALACRVQIGAWAPVIADVVDLLRCPHCAGGFVLDGRSVLCAHGHRFDIARDGHLTLMRRASRLRSDTASMVQAREAFLELGHYAGVAAAISGLVAESMDSTDGCVVDLGAGTGFYLSNVLDAIASARGLAVDLSPHAARRAARAHPRIASVVCDLTEGVPLIDAGAAAVLSVFAPRNASEIIRILKPGGVCVVAVPDTGHLRELREPLGMLDVGGAKLERLERTIGTTLRLHRAVTVHGEMILDHDAMTAIVLMGPAAWHRTAADVAGSVRALPPEVRVTLSVEVRAYWSQV